MSARNLSLKRQVLALVALALVGGTAAARVIDTGTPNGDIDGALVFDANDYVAGQIQFGGGTTIQSVFAHVLGGAAGQTFTIALYDDSPTNLPGNVLDSATAVFAGDGWNGDTNLHWSVPTSGRYWVAFEIGFADTLGVGTDTGGLLDLGAPNPLQHTAFDAGSGYQATATPLSFGARVVAVPEPDTVALMFGGAGVVLALARRRLRRPRIGS